MSVSTCSSAQGPTQSRNSLSHSPSRYLCVFPLLIMRLGLDPSSSGVRSNSSNALVLNSPDTYITWHYFMDGCINFIYSVNNDMGEYTYKNLLYAYYIYLYVSWGNWKNPNKHNSIKITPHISLTYIFFFCIYIYTRAVNRDIINMNTLFQSQLHCRAKYDRKQLYY